MLNRDRLIGGLQWFILLALFAYDGFTYLPEESNFALFKSIYYVIIFVAFVFIIALQTYHGRIPHMAIGRVSYVVQAFIWLYFIRLFYDFMITGVHQEIVTNPFAAVFLYINAAIIPFYGLCCFRWDLVDLRKLNTTILLIFLVMGMVSMYYILTGRAFDYIGDDGRFMGNESMDTIAFGHLGTSLVLMAISLFYQSDIRLWHKLLCIGAIVVGLFISVAAGSRGALVALVVCFIAYLYMNGHKMKILIGLPVLAILFLALLPVLNDILASFGNQALERLHASIYDPDSMAAGVTSGRDVLYKKAWDSFTDSPLLGSSLFVDGEYVHNSVFESFLGLGIFGGLLFVGLLVYTFIKAIQLGEQDKRYLFVALLFIQYLLYSLFSRTLSMLPLFWLSMFLVIYFNAHHDESLHHSTVL